MTILHLAQSLLLVGATAAPNPIPETADADERARVGQTHAYVFIDAEDLDGEVLRPGGVLVQTRGAGAHRSLIEVRGDFLDHLAALALEV